MPKTKNYLKATTEDGFDAKACIDDDEFWKESNEVLSRYAPIRTTLTKAQGNKVNCADIYAQYTALAELYDGEGSDEEFEHEDSEVAAVIRKRWDLIEDDIHYAAEDIG